MKAVLYFAISLSSFSINSVSLLTKNTVQSTTVTVCTYVCYIDPVRWAVLLLQCTTVNRQRHSRSTVKHVLPVYMGQTNIDLWVPQWIRLRLPSCHPGFDPKHTNYTFIINSHICAIFVVWIERNKQKEAGFDRFKKIINIDSSTAVSI